MMSIRHFLLGYYRAEIPAEDMCRTADRLFVRGIEYTVLRRTAKGYLLAVGKKDFESCTANAADPASPEGGDAVLSVGANARLCGLPAWWRFFRRRPGLPIGTVLAVLLFVFLSLFVWEVRVTGADLYDEEVIADALAELGLREGAFLPTLNTDSVVSAYLASGAPVSFMNVQRKGTVLYVNCRPNESKNTKTPSENGRGANIIATRDAVVEEINVENGRAAVTRGAVVKKGDLLISGIFEGQNRLFVTRAGGQVMGRVGHTIVIDIPYEQSVETTSGTTMTGLSVCILGRKIRLFSRAAADEKSVTEETRLYLFDLIRLPVTVQVTRKLTLAEKTVTFSENEVVQRAYARLRALRTALIGEGELLSSAVNGYFTDTGYHLECELVYLENIAQSIDFSYD